MSPDLAYFMPIYIQPINFMIFKLHLNFWIIVYSNFIQLLQHGEYRDTTHLQACAATTTTHLHSMKCSYVHICNILLDTQHVVTD